MFVLISGKLNIIPVDLQQKIFVTTENICVHMLQLTACIHHSERPSSLQSITDQRYVKLCNITDWRYLRYLNRGITFTLPWNSQLDFYIFVTFNFVTTENICVHMLQLTACIHHSERPSSLQSITDQRYVKLCNITDWRYLRYLNRGTTFTLPWKSQLDFYIF